MTGGEGAHWGSARSGGRGLWSSWAVRKEAGLAEGAAPVRGPPDHRRAVLCMSRALVSLFGGLRRRRLRSGAAEGSCLQPEVRASSLRCPRIDYVAVRIVGYWRRHHQLE